MDAAATCGVIRIVDDDASVLRALTRLIESMGMRVETYTTPQELLDLEGTDPAGCLLLDVQLPGMNGFELHDRLVATGRGAPVVFITAHRDARTRARAASVDGAACLEKPFEEDELLAALERALNLGT